MNDQELAERLAWLSAEMKSVSEKMHARAFVLHRHAEEIEESAKLMLERAIEISRDAEA